MNKITTISAHDKKGKCLVYFKSVDDKGCLTELKNQDFIVRVVYRDIKDRRCTYFLSRPKYPRTLYLLDAYDTSTGKSYTPDPGICLTKAEAKRACEKISTHGIICTCKPVKVGSS